MYNPNASYNRRLLELQNSTYLHNFRGVDWEQLITNLKDINGSVVTTNPDRWNAENTNYTDIEKLWADASFNPAAIQWINYYPGEHFDNDVVTKVAKYLRLNGVHRSWISRVNPGCYAPPHWDIDDNEQKYLTKGPIKRYSIFLNKPTTGHMFILADEYLYHMAQGAIVKWHNHNDWHTGINGGLTPKFMLHILGY